MTIESEPEADFLAALEEAGDLAEMLSPEALTDRRFRLVFDYWNGLRGKRLGPSRQEIDPLQLRPLLPSVAIVDVCHDPLNFRCRLAGTEVCDIHGIELRGRLVTELEPPAFARSLWLLLRRVVETGLPQASRWRFLNRLGYRRNFEVLRLPLSDSGERVDNILLVANYGRESAQLKEYFLEVRNKAREA